MSIYGVFISGADGSRRCQHYETMTGAYLGIFEWLFLFPEFEVEWPTDEQVIMKDRASGAVVFVIDLTMAEGQVGHA